MRRRKKKRLPANVTGKPRRDCPDCHDTGMRQSKAPQASLARPDGTVKVYERGYEPCPCRKTGGQGELLLAPSKLDQARRAAGERED